MLPANQIVEKMVAGNFLPSPLIGRQASHPFSISSVNLSTTKLGFAGFMHHANEGWAISGLSFLFTIGLALILAKWLGPKGFMDLPGGRKQHQSPVPRIGGLAIILGLLMAWPLGWLDGLFSTSAWGALIAIATMGVLDDRFDLRARWKAMAGLGIGVMLALLGTLEVAQLPQGPLLFGHSLAGMHVLIAMLLLMLFWGVPQAFNLIDGANGLALGYALICLAVLTFAGTPVPYLLGSVAALFVLNWPRSRLFLGDCGSLSLGLFLAMIAFKTFGTQRPEAILWLFAYPAADVFQVVIIRMASGRSLGEADRNHLHHRWKEVLGTWDRLRVPILWAQAALCASGAVLGGSWRIGAWIGLGTLITQIGFFVFSSIRQHHRAMEEESTATGLPFSLTTPSHEAISPVVDPPAVGSARQVATTAGFSLHTPSIHSGAD